MANTRRYELTDEEWEQVKELLPPELTGKKGKPRKDNRIMLNAMVWLARSVAPWLDDGIPDNIFCVFALEAELSELRLDNNNSACPTPQALKNGQKKRNRLKQRRIKYENNAIVDALGYPVYFVLSEGQESDSVFAVPILKHVDMEGSHVLADKGYDSDKIIDYIYDNGGEHTIPSKAKRFFQKHYDWRLYKERHLVELFFQKLKNNRRIATCYDKLSSVFAGFICIASIGIWLNCTV